MIVLRPYLIPFYNKIKSVNINMPGFLTDNQKVNIKNIIDKIHDTFAREIVVYKFGQKVAVATTNEYNALYKRTAASNQQQLIQISQTIMARIKYEKFDQTNFYQERTQEKIIVPEGVVYIKVNKDGYDFIKDAKTIELDGKTFQIKSPGKPEGMFGPQYFQFLLIPLES
jgi:hypothetical protein